MLSNLKKIHGQPNWGPSRIWLSVEYFYPIISKLDKHVIFFLINYIATDIRARCFQTFLLHGAASATRGRHSIMCDALYIGRSISTSCSTGNPPLWLFWLVSLVSLVRQFLRNSAIF